MKVGDLVKQGDRVVKFKGARQPRRSRHLGIVVAIDGDIFPKEWDSDENTNRKTWGEVLGRRVDVFWMNGKFSKNFAENSLEVVSEHTRSSRR